MARRLPLGLAIVVLSVTLFGLADVLSGRGANPLLSLVKLVQLVVPIAALLGIRGPHGSARAEPIALATVGFLYVSTAAAAALTADVATMSLLFIVIAMGTATLLPWGSRSQLMTVLAGATAAIGSVAFGDG
ncbi:MAG: hypothetical protein ACREQ9_22440, partial [Candidatus Binatia bacterium]